MADVDKNKNIVDNLPKSPSEAWLSIAIPTIIADSRNVISSINKI